MIYPLYEQYTEVRLIRTDIYDNMTALYFRVVNDCYIIVTQLSILIVIALHLGSIIHGVTTCCPTLSDLRIPKRTRFIRKVNKSVVCMTDLRCLVDKIVRINPRSADDCYKALDHFINKTIEGFEYDDELEKYPDLIACLEDW